MDALVRAARRASDEEQRDALLDLWATAGSTTAADFREDQQDLPLAQRLNPGFDDYVLARSHQVADDALRYGLVRRRVDVDRWIDRRYLDAALKAQGLQGWWPRSDSQGKLLR